MKPLSRDEVAAAAGVSSATVSRVYNNPSSVSAAKQRDVFEAAEKLGYIPNKSASALRRNGTGIITLVELKKEQRPYYWGDLPIFKWFYTDVLHAVKNIIDESMFQLNIASASDSRDITALRGQTDGLICYDVDETAEAEMIAASNLPYVLGHHTKSFEGFNRSSTDNFEGGRLQAQLLKDTGCSSPAYITAHLDMVQPHLDRLEGFLSVYPEHDVRIVGDGIGRTAGFRAAVEIIGKVDGIAAVNDITAAGAGYALSEAGIKVQQDIPLVGYDNMPLSIALPFKLLSIDLRPSQIY
ncbi:MAG TPA: LacI family transcriptional regulator, partial [Spirochaeta sp.]|nr:LacI family transcriptional regulator [Spirochaeta sp.]